MSLKDELKPIIGNRRRFVLFRICGIGAKVAMQLCKVRQGTYNSWLHNPTFTSIYRRVDELAAEYFQEAVNLLRRDNQMAAVFLEEAIVQKMKEEIETGKYELVKTNLAKDVISRLMGGLDTTPQVTALSWEEKMLFLVNRLQIGNNGGELIEGEFSTDSQQETEHQEGHLISQGE